MSNKKVMLGYTILGVLLLHLYIQCSHVYVAGFVAAVSMYARAIYQCKIYKRLSDMAFETEVLDD